MSLHGTGRRRLDLALLAALSVAIAAAAGCGPEGAALVGDGDRRDGGEDGLPPAGRYEADSDLEGRHVGSEPEAQGLVDAPRQVAVFVGDELKLDLQVADPSLIAVRPWAIPDAAEFQSTESGAAIRWRPGAEDVGRHDLVFLVVDAVESDLVLAQFTIEVSVIPRFSLLEYGF
jgi:hypothetical protein